MVLSGVQCPTWQDRALLRRFDADPGGDGVWYFAIFRRAARDRDRSYPIGARTEGETQNAAPRCAAGHELWSVNDDRVDVYVDSCRMASCAVVHDHLE